MVGRLKQAEATGAKVQVPVANKAANANVIEGSKARQAIVCVIALGVLHVSAFL